MANRVNVTLGFTADTKQAKQAILDLQNTLSKLSTSSALNGSSDSLKQASAAAKELSIHLANAYNTNTGKIDLSKFNQSLKASKSNLTDLSLRLTSIGPEGQKAFIQLAQSITSADRTVVTLNSKLASMMTTLKNTIRWQVASTMVNNVVGAVERAVGYAEDLNESLNSIRIVSGQSTAQMAKFAEQANKAAKALSSTTLDYTDAALIYYQQGLTDEEVLARTDVTIKMANAAGESAQKVSDQLTAVWNNFYDGSKSLEYYADVMTKLGAATASSTDEISEGLEKFAAVANTIGLSYEYATAALTTITSNTRESADVVGTALKTIFSRMQDLDLGKTLEDGVTLGQYSQAMASVGIQVLDINGSLIDMDDILDQMAAKWDNLSKAQQVALAQSVAGVRQYNQLVALMDNWNKTDADSMIANLGYVENATGTLQEQADIFAESWEGASNRVEASMQALYSDIIDDKFFIKLLNYLSEGLDSVDALIDGMGGIKPILIGIVGYLTAALSNQIMPAFRSMRENFDIIFSGSSKSAFNASSEANKAIDSVLKNNGTQLSESDRWEVEAAKELNLIKAEYDKIASELTDKEKAQYETQIAILQVQQEQVSTSIKKKNAAEDELRDLQKSLTVAENRLQATKDEVKAKKEATQAELVLNKKKEIKNISSLISDKEINKENISNTNNLKTKTGLDKSGIGSLFNKYSKEYDKATDEIVKKQLKLLIREQSDQRDKLTTSFNTFLETLAKQYTTENSEDLTINNDVTNKIANQLKKFSSLKGQGSVTQARELYAKMGDLEANLTEATYGLVDLSKPLANFKLAMDPKNTNIKSMTKAAEELEAAIRGAKVESKDFEDILKQLGQSGFVKEYNKALKELTEAENELAEAEKELQELQAKKISDDDVISDSAVKAAQAKVDEFKDKITVAQEKVNDFKNEIKQAQDEVDKLSKSFKFEHIAEGAEALSQFAGGASQVVASIAAFKSAITAFSNDDLSGFEKATTFISGMAIALPSLITGLKNLKTGFEALKLVIEKAGISAAAASGGIIIGLALVASAIAVAVNLWKKWKAASPEGQLEAAQEKATELSEALEEAKTKANELESAFDNYNSISDALAEATRGTEEWNKALQENNEKVLELLRLYPELADTFVVDTDGVLRIDANKLKESSEKLQSETNQLNVESTNATVDENNAQFIVDSNKVFEDLNKSSNNGIKGHSWLASKIGTSLQGLYEKYGANYTDEDIKNWLLPQNLSHEEFEIAKNFFNSARAKEAVSSIEVQKQSLESQNKSLKLATLASLFASDEDILGVTANFVNYDTTKTAEQLLTEGRETSNILSRLDSDQLTVLNALKTRDFNSLNFNQFENLKEIFETIPDYIKYLIDEDISKIEIPELDKISYYNTQAETAKNRASNANDIASTLTSGDELDETQTANLNDLINKYEYLNQLKEDGGHKYLQALRDIGQQEEDNYLEALQHVREQLNAQKINLQTGILNALRADNTEAAEDLQNQLEAVLDKITENDYSIKIAVEADIDSDRLGITSSIEEIEQLTEYLKDGLNISYDTVEKIIADGHAAILQGATATAEGLIKLNQDVVNNYIITKNAEIKADQEANIDKIEERIRINKNYKQYLEDQLEALKENNEEKNDNEKKKTAFSIFQDYLTRKNEHETNIEGVKENQDASESAVDNANTVGKAWLSALEQAYNGVKDVNEALAHMGDITYTFDGTKTFTEYVYTPEKIKNIDAVLADPTISDAMRRSLEEQRENYSDGYKFYTQEDFEEQTWEDILKQVDGDSSEAAKALNDVVTSFYEDELARVSAEIGTDEALLASLKSIYNNSLQTLGTLNEILERYHEINREIERQKRALDELATKKDRAFGAQRLKYIDEEIAGYKNLIEQQEKLQIAATAYLKADKQKLQELFGNSVIFNNYDEIDNYSSLYRNATDDQRDALEQYEETLDAMRDAQEAVKESLNTIQDLDFEKLEYQLELKIDIDDAKLKELDFLLTQYSDNFYKKAEALASTMDKVPMYDDMLKLYTNQIEKLTEAHNNNDISQADYIDGLKDSRDSIYEQLEALISLDQEMMTYYEDTLSAATAELDDFTDHMEHLTSVFDHYLSLMDLLGKKKDYSAMGDFLGGKAKTIRGRLDVAKEYYNVLADQRVEAERALASAADDEQRELLVKNLDAIIDELDAAEEEVLSMTEEYIEAMRAVIENNMNEIMENLENALTKGLGFDNLLDNFEKLNTRQEEYLTKTNQIYETNKLMRTANKALDETDNKVAKQKLQNFIEETEAMQDQKILSEYELEVQKAKYDLLLAEIALEEAQAAKSTVRLSRDSEGNYGYVYTADQDAIDDAQQEVDDAQNRLYNLSLEGQETYLEKYLQTQQEANEALAELWNQYYNEHTLTEEEYWAARNQTETYYHQLLTGYQDLFTYATQVSTEAQQDYWVKGYDNILLKADEWKSTVHSYYDEIGDQIKIWRDLQETANSDVSGALDNSKMATENLTKESEELADMLQDEVIGAIDKEIEQVRLQTEAYADQREELQGLIADYQAYLKLVNGTIAAESGEANSSGAVDYSREMAKAYLAGDTNAIYSWGAFRSEKEANGNYTSATTSRLYDLFESASKGNKEAQQLIEDAANGKKYFTDETLKKAGIYDTGGYTGAWGPEGKLAFLHEKELVLNKDDTENLLKSITFIRQIVNAINSQASIASLFNLSSSGVGSMNSMLEQNVHIEASFPNATDHNEIEEAFNNLVNRASQYANRK